MTLQGLRTITRKDYVEMQVHTDGPGLALSALSSARGYPPSPSVAGQGQGAALCKFSRERKLDLKCSDFLVLPPHCPGA